MGTLGANRTEDLLVVRKEIVSSFFPCFSADQSVETDGSFKTIRVRLARPLSQDTIEDYFENRRKSGGGDIESCTIARGNRGEIQEALITFSDSTGNMEFLHLSKTFEFFQAIRYMLINSSASILILR